MQRNSPTRDDAAPARQRSQTISAGGVVAAQLHDPGAGGGAIPTPALQAQPRYAPKDIVIRPVPASAARHMCQRYHYSGTYPGGSLLNFGAFAGGRLLEVAVIGVGPPNVHRFFQDASNEQVACLSRLWLHDSLGPNSESYCLAIIMRNLRKKQCTIKAIIAYSDPSVGHNGVIYMAAGFRFLGTSQGTPKYRLPKGTLQHSRSFSHRWGTRDRRYFEDHGVRLEVVPQAAKSRVPGSGVRGRGSGERETTASSLAGKEESSRKEDNSGQGKDGPAGAIAQGGNGR